MACFELVSGKTDPVVLLIKVSKAVKTQPTPQLLLPQYYSVLLLAYKPVTYYVRCLFSTHQQSCMYTDATVCQAFYHHTTTSGGWSPCDQLITTSAIPSGGLLEKYSRAYNTILAWVSHISRNWQGLHTCVLSWDIVTCWNGSLGASKFPAYGWKKTIFTYQLLSALSKPVSWGNNSLILPALNIHPNNWEDFCRCPMQMWQRRPEV